MKTILEALFGWPAAWGTGGNLIAWVICGAISFGWLRAKLHAHHVAQMAQSARHHKELMAQADTHHQELKAYLTAHCADIKEHVNAVVADAQASAGSGSNPGQSGGLPADERVVPPAATIPPRGRRR